MTPEEDKMLDGWRSRNPWFGVDKGKTDEAMRIHNRIVYEGFPLPGTHRYYIELDNRLNGSPPCHHVFRKEQIEEMNTELECLVDELRERVRFLESRGF